MVPDPSATQPIAQRDPTTPQDRPYPQDAPLPLVGAVGAAALPALAPSWWTRRRAAAAALIALALTGGGAAGGAAAAAHGGVVSVSGRHGPFGHSHPGPGFGPGSGGDRLGPPDGPAQPNP